MSLELKEGANTEGLPTISLGGTPYFIPRLSLRSRIAIATLLPKLNAVIKRMPTKDEIIAGVLPQINEGDFDALIDVVRHALSDLYPKATRDDILDIPMDVIELLNVTPVIIAQGSSRRVAAGEALATGPSNSTGEGSSPNS